MVLSPEHPLVEQITSEAQRDAVADYVAQAARQTELERTSDDRDKTGVFTGAYAINPVNQERIPIWICGLRPDQLRHRRDHGSSSAR